jgi:hypothetical protein
MAVNQATAHPFAAIMGGNVDVLPAYLHLVNSTAYSIRLPGTCIDKTTHAAGGSRIYIDVWLVPDPSHTTLAHNVCEFLSDSGVILQCL